MRKIVLLITALAFLVWNLYKTVIWFNVYQSDSVIDITILMSTLNPLVEGITSLILAFGIILYVMYDETNISIARLRVNLDSKIDLLAEKQLDIIDNLNNKLLPVLNGDAPLLTAIPDSVNYETEMEFKEHNGKIWQREKNSNHFWDSCQ
ncbi:MAG: hypothetical protein ACPGAN_07735 [Candidatus Poseidoniaceae archaeon]